MKLTTFHPLFLPFPLVNYYRVSTERKDTLDIIVLVAVFTKFKERAIGCCV